MEVGGGFTSGSPSHHPPELLRLRWQTRARASLCIIQYIQVLALRGEGGAGAGRHRIHRPSVNLYMSILNHLLSASIKLHVLS